MTSPNGRAQRRRRPDRQDRRRILVVTEGTITEPQYIERLNQYLRSSGVVVVVKPIGLGKDPLEVVRRCLLERAKGSDLIYDHYVCLADVDEHTTLDAAIDLAERESVLLLISNLKFEVWLRWHAEDKTSILDTRQLDRLMNQLGLLNGKHLAASFPFDAVDQACRTAHRIDSGLAAGRKGPNPSSAMPLMIDLMRRT